MALKLPFMNTNIKTRVGHDAQIFYNLGQAVFVGRSGVGDNGSVFVQEQPCGSVLVAPVGGFAAAINKPPNSGVITVAGSTIPAGSPLYYASELEGLNSIDITAYAITGPVGDSIDILLLPDPANDVLICFDNGWSMQPGQVVRPIGRKFRPVDHYVCQRPDNTLTLNDLLVNSIRGIKAISGRAVTIIVKVFPCGGAIPCEIQYYTNVLAVPPGWNNPADGNQSVEISVSAPFDMAAHFTARP